MPDLPVLYSMPLSHYCVCADRVLAFKGVRFRTEPVAYHDKRGLLAATGQDYVPALVWTDGTVVPWTQISDFLEARVPEPTLFPNGQRAVAETLDNWGHQVLEERVWRSVVTEVPAHLADDVERWVFEEMQARARGPWELLERRREEFWKEVQPYLGLVDRMVADHDWVLGSASLADFGLYGGLWPLLYVGRAVPDGFPALARWADRIRSLGAAPPRARARRRTMK